MSVAQGVSQWPMGFFRCYCPSVKRAQLVSSSWIVDRTQYCGLWCRPWRGRNQISFMSESPCPSIERVAGRSPKGSEGGWIWALVLMLVRWTLQSTFPKLGRGVINVSVAMSSLCLLPFLLGVLETALLFSYTLHLLLVSSTSFFFFQHFFLKKN